MKEESLDEILETLNKERQRVDERISLYKNGGFPVGTVIVSGTHIFFRSNSESWSNVWGQGMDWSDVFHALHGMHIIGGATSDPPEIYYILPGEGHEYTPEHEDDVIRDYLYAK